MRYIIDGYNLMFRVLRAGDNLTEKRHAMIHDFSIKADLLNLDAVIVFDAQYQQEEVEISHIRQLGILFTRKGQIADDLICQLIKREENPRDCTVVTSDNRLAWRSRRLGAKTETVESFFRWLTKRYQNRLQQSEPKQKKVLKEPTLKPSHKDLEDAFDKGDAILNDFDRWLKIFEERAESENNSLD